MHILLIPHDWVFWLLYIFRHKLSIIFWRGVNKSEDENSYLPCKRIISYIYQNTLFSIEYNVDSFSPFTYTFTTNSLCMYNFESLDFLRYIQLPWRVLFVRSCLNTPPPVSTRVGVWGSFECQIFSNLLLLYTFKNSLY